MTSYRFGTNNQLEILWQTFSNHPDGKWVMKIENAVKLYETIKKYQPAQVLELGTGIGCSTAIMASALDNGRIMTVEQNQRLIDVAKELIPFELKQHIQFEYSPVTVIKPINTIDPFRGWMAYLNFPWVDWDFVVVDGPGPFMLDIKGTQYCVDLPAGDIIILMQRLRAGAKVYVDKRKDSVNLYKRYLCWYYELIEEDGTHALFQRTKEKLKDDFSDLQNSDVIRGMLEEMNYFK